VLIARAPLRISLAGGGTDLPAYYQEYGGMVVSAAIDKYFYVFISPNGNGSLQVSSANYQTFIRHSRELPIPMDGELRHARAILNEFGIQSGYSLFLASEVPPGTGLGSSSAAAVALLKAISTLKGAMPSKSELAELACRMEQGLLGMPIGKQDQYASAFGGINAITFSSHRVDVEPLVLSPKVRDELQRSVMLFLTTLSHDSSQILQEQGANMERADPTVVESLHAIRASAEEVREVLERGELHRLGPILHATWEYKKRLANGITTREIDHAYERALEAGASGGKIVGAGGGGFLLLYCDPARQRAVSEGLEQLGLVRLDFHFDQVGARVLVNNATA
jgi:D-glycero-alpha-D-manno-heptose-7-phosphate kinase